MGWVREGPQGSTPLVGGHQHIDGPKLQVLIEYLLCADLRGRQQEIYKKESKEGIAI